MAGLGQVKRKEIKVVLTDGIEREIKFTLNAMAELEEKYGSVEEAFKVLEKGSIKSIRFMLWATLQHEDEPLTEKQVGNLIDVASIGEIMNAMSAVTEQDMPEQDKVVAIATVVNNDPN